MPEHPSAPVRTPQETARAERVARYYQRRRDRGAAIFTITCDGCATTINTTTRGARAAGWSRPWRTQSAGLRAQIDLCPACRGGGR